MICKELYKCFEEIDAYCLSNQPGYALIINADNYDDYQAIASRLKADHSKKCHSISSFAEEDAFPIMDDVLAVLNQEGQHVLLGFSQLCMFYPATYYQDTLRKFVGNPVKGHAIVVLEHSAQYLKIIMNQDLRTKRRIILLDHPETPIPQIQMTDDPINYIGVKPVKHMKRLLNYLEQMTNESVEKHPTIMAETRWKPVAFTNSVYSITAVDGLYESLCKQYADIGAGTRKSYGTDAQWRELSERLIQHHTLAGVITDMFGSTANLASHISLVFEQNDGQAQWYLWLGMKIFGTSGFDYLSTVMTHSSSPDDLLDHVYMDLLDIDCHDPEFYKLYNERKHWIMTLPESITEIDLYCSKVGKFERDAVYYLTDCTDREKLYLLQCFEKYEYPEKEIFSITKAQFPALCDYLSDFTFNKINTTVPDAYSDFRDVLTAYFHEYKVQKITNHIHESFYQMVMDFAVKRPFNWLQPRSAIVKGIKQKDTAQLFFFDALGVEFLGYIIAKCERLGLIIETHIGHGVLPSITAANKEFIPMFAKPQKDIKDLDELKHHSKVFDYERRHEPIHLFSELQIIDDELERIHSQLVQGDFDRAVICSDHGASRLAVIAEKLNDSPIEMEEKGEHSGRCCPVAEYPKLPYAAYENGYAVLADYERFKGSRKANVEVHGGATLEEVVVPILILSKKPDNIELCFVKWIIELKGREPATITLYSNIPLTKPTMIIDMGGRELTYEGEPVADQQHFKFIMPEIKRAKTYTATVYDGGKLLQSGLTFTVQKGTKEVDFFGM